MHQPTNPCSLCRTNPTIRLQSFSGKPKLRSSRCVVEDDKLRLEEDIAEDGLSDAIIALETTEAASALRCRRIVHVATWHNGCVAFDLESEIRKGGGAREDVSAVCLAVGGSGHFSVVGGDEVVWEEEKGGSGVGDGGDAFADCRSRTHFVSAGCEAPETLRVVHGGVGDVAGVFAGVDVAEVVAAGLTLLQVGGEEGRVEGGLGVGEEGLYLVGRDGIDRGKGEAEEAIALVLSEFRADRFGQFDGLASHRCTADVNDVSVDVAAG